MIHLPESFSDNFASGTTMMLEAFAPIYTPILYTLLAVLAIGLLITFLHHK